MADYLEPARIVIEKWEKAMSVNPENLFLLNEAQCTQLWRNLRRVYDAFAPSLSYPLDIQQKCLNIFIDFYIVVVRGGAIVEMCSSKKFWLNAALFYGDNQRMFQELSVDLQFCMDSAHKLTESLFCTSHDHRPLMFVDNLVIRHDQADVDFRRDTTRLKIKLEEYVQQPDLEEKEKSLAGYLIERENYRSCTDRHYPNIQDPNSFESGIPSFFETERQYPKVGKNIARGGLDGVTVVEVEWLGLKCAKKEFLKALSKENFVKEVNALVGLNHPNVVKLLCSRSEMPDPSFLMEFVDMSLSEFITERKRHNIPIKIVPAVDLMLQMALGMEYLHGQGVVHRDLKSPNILVNPSSHPGLRSMGYAVVKVTDFGLAKVEVFGPTVPTWRMRGTPYWIAPEAIDPKGRIDWRKADTYSFAITCVEILKSEVGSESGSQEFPQECPIYLCEFLKKCQDPKNPNNRPSFEEIVATLRMFKKHLLLGTAPERAPEQVPVKAVSPRKRFWAGMKKIMNKVSKQDLVVLPSLEVLPDPTENELYRTTIAGIRSGLETVASLCSDLNGKLEQVRVCHIQCDHIVKEYLDGVGKVKSTYDHVSRTDLLNLFRSKKLQTFTDSLGRLGSSILAAIELLQECGNSPRWTGQWKLMALAISAPLPPNRTYSKFGKCLLELYWNLYVIHHVFHVARPHPSEMSPQLLSIGSDLRFEWCNQRCKLIVRRNTIDIGSEDAVDEFLELDAERQDQDRKRLLKSLNRSPISLLADDIHLPELAAVLKKRLQSSWESVDESNLASFASQEDCYFIEIPRPTLMDDYKDAYAVWPWFDGMDIVRRTPFKNEYIFRWLGARVYISGDPDDHNQRSEQQQQESNSRFRTEVQVLERVQHPNVVQFLGYAYNVGDPISFHRLDHFFLTEPSRTPLLYPTRRGGRYFHGLPFPLRLTVEMLLQIVEGMIHVHQCGVLHRDLNPSNILYERTDCSKGFGVDDFCTIKLTGFHTAVALEVTRPLNSGDRFHSQHPVGTFPFMAPEVWKNSLTGEGYTWSVDIWSFGMTACFILTGSIPYVLGLEGDEIVYRRDWATVEVDELFLGDIRDDCPVRLTELIKKCCTRYPEARPSFEQVRKELWTIKKDHDMRF